MRRPALPVQQVGNPGVQVDLDHDRHCEEEDQQWLTEDLLPLEAEREHQTGEQCHDLDVADTLLRKTKRRRVVAMRRRLRQRGSPI
jgi:hypothetical protein